MWQQDRLEGQGTQVERRGVSWLSGIDRQSGERVILYNFRGTPSLQPGDLESQNLPTVLAAGNDGDEGYLIAAPGARWRRLRAKDGPLSDSQLLDAARALRDAAGHGVVHGDLSPERFLVDGERLLLEGYGVPWRVEPGEYTAPESDGTAKEPGDIWSFAAAVDRLGVESRNETVLAVLKQCLSPDPGERPNAEELYLALESLLPLSTGPSETPNETAGSGVGVVEGPDYPRRGTPQATPPSAPGTSEELAADTPPVPADDSPTARRANRARLTLLGVLLAAVVTLALLAVYTPQRGPRPAPTAAENTIYVVEVEVSPADLPPVTIHLVSSPPGSSLARGERLGTAPRHLALDRPGTWSFQGSLQDRLSPVVEIEIPEDRSLTLTIPPE